MSGFFSDPFYVSITVAILIFVEIILTFTLFNINPSLYISKLFQKPFKKSAMKAPPNKKLNISIKVHDNEKEYESISSELAYKMKDLEKISTEREDSIHLNLLEDQQVYPL